MNALTGCPLLSHSTPLVAPEFITAVGRVVIEKRRMIANEITALINTTPDVRLMLLSQFQQTKVAMERYIRSDEEVQQVMYQRLCARLK